MLSGGKNVSPTMNPDIAKERTTSSFNRQKLTHLLYGGVEKTKRRQEIVNILFNDPLFCKESYFFSRTEAYANSIAKSVRMIEIAKQHHWNYDDIYQACVLTNFDTSLWLHIIMFIPTLEKLGTEEQKRKWLPLANGFQILGTYAQTELGHGTNLQGLETTATYDPRTEEFVLNTPTITSMKWWPGNMAKTSTHAIVLAHLTTHGKHHGMQAFILQLRSLDNHSLMPGITTGDIGPKMGANNFDNGYLILKNARVPRNNMLMRFNVVSPDGTFSKQGSSKANYAVMTGVRVDFVVQSYAAIAVCATIAIRYSSVRRQSYIEPGSGEVQILDFQTQQYRLFNPLAQAFAFYFQTKNILGLLDIFHEEVSVDNYTNLPVMHCQASCLKAFCTNAGSVDTEDCRRACGGHGYLLSAGLGVMVNNFLSAVTVEGENTVLYLQAARVLLKCYSDVLKGKEVHSCMHYLAGEEEAAIETTQDCYNHDKLVSIYCVRAKRLLESVAGRLQGMMADGKKQHLVWNACAVELTVVARAHAHLTVVRSFTEGVQTVTDPDIKRVLTILCHLYLLHGIVQYSGEFLKTGAITAEQLEMIETEEVKLLPLIRPDAVTLVDAFDFHDKTMMSAIGAYDGNAYENLYETTKRNPLNETQVNGSYYKYLRPWFLKSHL